jgi:hypothetical protein
MISHSRKNGTNPWATNFRKYMKMLLGVRRFGKRCIFEKKSGLFVRATSLVLGQSQNSLTPYNL